MNKIDYLDLEIQNYQRTKIITHQFKLYCNIDHLDNQYRHTFYSNNSQKNFIVNLLINLSSNLELVIKKLKPENSETTLIRTNLDFLKTVIEDFTFQKEVQLKNLIYEIKELKLELANNQKQLGLKLEQIESLLKK